MIDHWLEEFFYLIGGFSEASACVSILQNSNFCEKAVWLKLSLDIWNLGVMRVIQLRGTKE